MNLRNINFNHPKNMSDQNKLAVVPPPAFLAVAGLTGLDSQYLVDTVKRQCFKGDATDAQVDAFISIACEMKVNPLLLGMLYAYPISGGGIVPIMGPSGVYKKLVEHPEVVSWETEVLPADVTIPPTHAITKIWRKGVERPLTYTALLSEWKINSNPNWNSRPRHMLALRSLKHCANQIIHGIPYDEDDRVIMAMQNVTGTGDENPVANGTPAQAAQAERPTPKPRATRGAAAAKEVVGEVVPEKPADPTPPAQDIQQAMQAREAKTVTNSPATAAPAPTPATASPAPTPATSAPAPAATSRAFLAENEKITVTAKVESFEALKAKIGGVEFAAIKATLSGGYVGEVRQKEGGAKFEGAGVVALPPWQVGAVLKFELLGIKSTAPASSPSHGKIITWVQSVAAEAEEMG